MTVTTVDSKEARTQWRSLLDATSAGDTDVVITRYGKPVSVLIDYEDWLALQGELNELRAVRRADVAYEEYLSDPATARPYAEIRTELVAEGLLDEEV